MKNKLFYLLIMPSIWIVITIITANELADRVWLLSVAPAIWLTIFIEPIEITVFQFQLGSFPGIFIVGLILLLLKIKPKTVIVSSIILALVLWIALCIFALKGTLIRVPGAVFVWFLCCYNFSVCLLPLLFLSMRLISLINKKIGKD